MPSLPNSGTTACEAKQTALRLNSTLNHSPFKLRPIKTHYGVKQPTKTRDRIARTHLKPPHPDQKDKIGRYSKKSPLLELQLGDVISAHTWQGFELWGLELFRVQGVVPTKPGLNVLQGLRRRLNVAQETVDAYRGGAPPGS